MKRNTGCNANNICPPLTPCDIAEVDRVDCIVDAPFAPYGVAVPVIDVQVPLVEVLLEADVEARITLPTPARAIKGIEKNVSLIQCKAVPGALLPENFIKLYITGVVHKNIQYVEDCSGVIKDFSVEIPFSCNSSVELETPPQFPFGVEYSIKNSILQLKQLSEDGMGADRCTTGSLTYELYNEPIKCKLVASAVKEIDLLKNFDCFGRFQSITEKMEVLLLFKLLQTQQVDSFDTDLEQASVLENVKSKPMNANEKFRTLINRTKF